MSTDHDYISFPPGTLAETPLRIPLLRDSANAIALAKPAGLPAFQDTRLGGGPKSILTVINQRIGEGVAQFERLGLEACASLNLLDRDASGVLLLAKNSAGRAELKNAMGSSQFLFRYRFFTAAKPEAAELACELPLAIHREKPLALVSHSTGKKTATKFRRVETFGHCELWESESEYDRFHQVRLHASEAGIPLLGDPLYGNARGRTATPVPPKLVPLLPATGVFLHLHALRFPDGESAVEVEAPYSREWRMFQKKLAR